MTAPLWQDFLYGEQLEGWAANGHLTLFTAFSREQARMRNMSSHLHIYEPSL